MDCMGGHKKGPAKEAYPLHVPSFNLTIPRSCLQPATICWHHHILEQKTATKTIPWYRSRPVLMGPTKDFKKTSPRHKAKPLRMDQKRSGTLQHRSIKQPIVTMPIAGMLQERMTWITMGIFSTQKKPPHDSIPSIVSNPPMRSMLGMGYT